MFATSVDLMYGVISLCIIVFTIFLVWIMFYVIQILKQGNEILTEIREKIMEFQEALIHIREKVMSSAKSITFIASEIGTVVDLVKNRASKKSSKPSSRRGSRKKDE